jgi:hypothetical protein
MKYFKSVKTEAEAKLQFKVLAKELHPDLGGDAEAFKAMMNEYESLSFNGTNCKVTNEEMDFFNIFTERRYSGGNIWRLYTLRSGNDRQFATYRQWSENGCQVKKGEHGIQIQFAGEVEKQDKETGKKSKYFTARVYTVFGESQVEKPEVVTKIIERQKKLAK